MVQHEVDAWAGSQGSELLQELDRREEEVARAVVPLALQGDEDESVGRQCETLLRDRRAQHVAASCGPTSYADLQDHFVVAFMGCQRRNSA